MTLKRMGYVAREVGFGVVEVDLHATSLVQFRLSSKKAYGFTL
jgi:hypothetical protein